MEFFKRRNPSPQNQPSGTAPQYEGTGPPQEYEGTGGTPQDQRPGGTPQYEGSGGTPPDQRAGGAPQYESSRAAPQHERSDTSYQAGGAHRGAAQTRSGQLGGLPGGLAGLILGLGTVVLGLIVAAHPTQSFKVVAILLGVLMIISGVYQVVQSLRTRDEHRAWRGIAGVLFFLVGIFLIRHVSLSLSIVALFAGFAFIIAGIAALVEAISGHGLMERVWAGLFGVILVFAGIAAITTPITFLNRLGTVLGWAFFAIGILQIIGAIMSMRTRRRQQTEQVSVPGQRTAEPLAAGTYGDSPAANAEAPAASPGRPRADPR
jgi:uncharacterized membrane protein HdeD (DUF308 family)